MNEKDLNIEYICEKTLLNKDDELVPIILNLIQDSYKAGLCQAEFDNTMNLIEENEELKQKYENAVADYETTMAEKEQLKKQLKDKTENYKRMKDNFDSKVDVLTEIDTQRKEFIKYLEDKINFYKINTQGYSMDLFEEILQKYKRITGVSNEKEN
nr:MAG TPA: hypothetical protein [Caudoviricetes sp.]